MSAPTDLTDEYILAAFLSGELPQSLRREIVKYLSESPGARDVLSMAREAMDVVDSGDGAARPIQLPPRAKRRAPSHDLIQAIESRGDQRNQWKVTAFFAAAVLVLTLVVAMLVINQSQLNRLISPPVWQATWSQAESRLSWAPIEEAQAYHVVRHNLDTDTFHLVERTSSTMFVVESAISTVNETWRIWAVDDSGRILRQSDPVILRTTD